MSGGSGEKLSRHQERAIAALIEQPTISAAASACGIAESTLRRWLKQPAFAAAYATARRELVSTTVHRIQQASGGALETLERTLRDKKAPHTAKVRAAETILQLALRERPSAVGLPDLGSAEGITAALAAVTRAVAQGTLTAAEGEALGNLLQAQLGAVATTEIERKLVELEEATREARDGERGRQ